MATELSDRQARDLRTMLAGVPLARYVDDDSWHLLRGDRAERVLKRDAAFYRQRGWIERVGFEESVPMEVYTLTPTGRTVAARTPELTSLAAIGPDEPVPVMVVPVVWATHEPPGGWEQTFVEVPLTDNYLDLLTSRQRLAEYLAAVESDFDSVHFADYDARLFSVARHSTSSGALGPIMANEADYAFLSVPLDEVRDTATDVELHASLATMVVTDVSVYWQIEVEPRDDLLEEADGTILLTTVVLPDEVAAAAREFAEEDRGDVFGDSYEVDDEDGEEYGDEHEDEDEIGS